MRKIIGYENYAVDEKGNVFNTKTNKKLSPSTKENGYLFVSLCKKCVYKAMYVHRLVGMAYIPNPENKPQINHLNGIKSDNRIENLEWCTASENHIHACENNLWKSTEKHKNAMVNFNKTTKSKLVLNTETGIYYNSVGEAAEAHNIKRKTLICMLGGFDRNKTKLMYI